MRQIRTLQGDTADLICYRELGRTAGVTEQLLELNPRLADYGHILPAGLLVNLPDKPVQEKSKTLNVWD
ncbi:MULTISPECIES: tail protein X [Spongiibacter]|uniref:tail protein X n=1 Tax=Spongiibacter TaxID=630749 RepID=UPI0019616CD6|nr:MULTISPECIES: tail protein X [Spongiibacter]MBM7423809.1 phage tail protein X [Spongiibacter marinus]USA43325.1 tail protein X [Spongiibacter taiwanensis]